MRIFYLLSFFVLFSVACSTKDTCPEKEYFMFSYFSGLQTDSTGDGQDGLHLMWSEDGFKWEALNQGNSFLKPMAGKNKLMRDPCIIQGPDDLFHMVWTVSWEEPAIGYANSKNLIEWSEQKTIVPFDESDNARNCWAPEITYDPEHDHFMIYWSTTIPGKFPETDSSNIKGRNHRTYYTLTKDFESFSPTQMLYDPGFNSIDAVIYPHEGRWVMFIKDESRYPEVQKNLKMAWSDNLTGPYSPASEPFSQHWVEGPTATKVGSLWYLYYDEYPTDKHDDFLIGLKLSHDLVHWEDVMDLLQLPPGVRHGTVFKVKESILENLKKL